RALYERADRATGDHPGPRCGGLQQDDARTRLADDLVRDRGAHHRHLEHLAPRLLDALGDRGGHLPGLAVAETDAAGPVANDDERREREASAAAVDLGDTVDRDHPLLVGALLLVPGVVASHQICNPPSRAPSATAATRPWYRRPPRSNTTVRMPAPLARSAISCPTAFAFAIGESPPTSASEAAAIVAALASSISWAQMCRVGRWAARR